MHKYGLLICLSPILALLTSFINRNVRGIKITLWAFTVFYGISLHYYVGGSNDFGRLYDWFLRWTVVDSFDFEHIFRMHLSYGKPDYYFSFILYIASRLGDSVPVLGFFIFSIFGYFYSSNIAMSLEIAGDVINRNSAIDWLFIVSLLFLPSIEEATGLRFALATVVFLYFYIQLVATSKPKYFVFLLVPVLIHYTFLLFIPIFALFYYLRDKISLNMLGLTYFASMILPNVWLDTGTVDNIISTYFAADIYESSQSYLEKSERLPQVGNNTLQQNLSFHAKYYAVFYKFIVSAIALDLLFKIKLFVRKVKGLNHFSNVTIQFLKSALFIGIFSNLIDHIPSAGRFGILSVFLLTLSILTARRNFEWQKNILVRGVVLFSQLLFVIVSVRILFYFATISTFLSNPVLFLLVGGDGILLDSLIR